MRRIAGRQFDGRIRTSGVEFNHLHCAGIGFVPSP